MIYCNTPPSFGMFLRKSRYGLVNVRELKQEGETGWDEKGGRVQQFSFISKKKKSTRNDRI